MRIRTQVQIRDMSMFAGVWQTKSKSVMVLQRQVHYGHMISVTLIAAMLNVFIGTQTICDMNEICALVTIL